MFVELAFYRFTHVLSAIEVQIQMQRTLLKLIMFKTMASETAFFQGSSKYQRIFLNKNSPLTKNEFGA
jgi:hypothetical protein